MAISSLARSAWRHNALPARGLLRTGIGPMGGDCSWTRRRIQGTPYTTLEACAYHVRRGGSMDPKILFFSSGLELARGEGDLKNALGNMLPIVAQLANSDGASLFLVDEAAQVLKPLVTYGLPEPYVKLCGFVPIGEQCCGRAVQHRKLWVVSDMLSDPLFSSARNAAMETSVRAAFSVPVICDDGKCIGSLACHYKRPYTPTKENIDLNRTWAKLIAHTLCQYQGTQLSVALSQHGASDSASL
jgi:hypothetical protein